MHLKKILINFSIADMAMYSEIMLKCAVLINTGKCLVSNSRDLKDDTTQHQMKPVQRL